MIVFPPCLLIFAGDTRHAPSLRFTERLCGVYPFKKCISVETGRAPCRKGKTPEETKNCAKAHLPKDCIPPLPVDLCWRHAARRVSTVSQKALWRVPPLKRCISVETGRAPCRKGKAQEEMKNCAKAHLPKDCISPCLLIFAGDTRHAASLRFTERLCGVYPLSKDVFL